ncbi:glycosyltransferase family 2 protein [candidate division KSB1 bacterium]|nr:glycosyltransferase family 2 protein [candidate division KSB1 bacterium]
MNNIKKVPISVLIPTRNEELNIKKCLESVKWAAEIFVIDSNSQDKTVEIAKRYTENVINFDWNGQLPRKKNWALSSLNFSNEWILLLDADEEVTKELRKEIEIIVNSEIFPYYAYKIRFDFYFLNKLISHGDPLWVCRFFKRGHAIFEKLDTAAASGYDVEIHENLVVDGKVGKLKNKIIHKDFEDLNHHFAKHHIYADWEVLVQRERQRSINEKEIKPTLFGSSIEKRRYFKELFFKIPLGLKSIVYFFYTYILRLGFLDGLPGLIYWLLKAIYWFEIDIKLYEQRIRNAHHKS